MPELEPKPATGLLPEIRDDVTSGVSKLVVAGVVLCFGCAVVGTLAFDAFHWGEEPQARAFATLAETDLEDVVEGRATAALDRVFKRASLTRRLVSPPWARFLGGAFRHTVEEVHIGKDGWLFVSSRLRTRDDLDARHLDVQRSLFSVVERRLGLRGTALLTCLVPRKAVVNASFLGGGFELRPGLYGELLDRLHAEGLAAPDLLAAFRERPEGAVWSPADTHWNLLGQLIAAEELARTAGALVPKGRRSTKLRQLPDRVDQGDILRAAGWIDPEERPPLNRDAMSPHFLVTRPRVGALNVMQNIAATDAPLWLIGTSFSNFRPFVTYLEHYCDLPTRLLAMNATGPIDPLQQALRSARLRDGKVRCVIWEVPAFVIFSPAARRMTLEDLPRALMELPPPEPAVLASWTPAAPRGAADGFPPLTTRVAGGRRIFVVPQGELLSGGRGTVLFRLKRRPSGGPLRVHLTREGYVLTLTWPQDHEEVTLPVVAAGATRLHRIVVDGRHAGALERVSLCLDTPLAPDATWMAGKPGAGSTTFNLSSPLRPGPASCLVLRREGPRNSDQRLKRVVLRGIDGTECVLLDDPAPAPPPALAAFSLGRARRLDVMRVTVDWEGPGPAPLRCSIR